MKIRLLLSYKGTQFFGWQRQSKHRSIQHEIEKSLYQLFKQELVVVGSGRTDTGVHALGQTAHFEITESSLKNKNLKKALNGILPSDISVLECWKAPDDFHARISATKKTYLYYISTGENSPVLFPDLLWWRQADLKLESLQKIAEVFKGSWDFKSFQNSGSQVQSTIRTIYQSRWYQFSESLYCYKITGSGFLKQMVRNIVGTSVELLKSEKAPQKLRQILRYKDRKQAFKAAPGQGLYLKKVFYPSSLDKACYKL